jgi:hypothetical protein
MARTKLGRAARSARLIVAAALVSGTAHAAGATPSVTSSSRPLRPARHLDGFGRTVEDVCPEYVMNQRRCYAQRVVTAGAQVRPDIVPVAPMADPACKPAGGGGGTAPLRGTMGPKDVLAAYDIPAVTKASGQIVALVELPSVNAMADVNAYRNQYGIPQLPACPVDGSGVPVPGGVPCFARVGEDGSTQSVTTNDCVGWSGETGLDMDMVSAACPDCSIVVVEARNTNDLDGANTVSANVLHAAAASNSWGGPETGQDSTSFYDVTGMLVFAASGDSGYLNESLGDPTGTSFPSSAPMVIAVGGTILNEVGGQYSEVVWNDATLGPAQGQQMIGAGGSGCSTEFARPTFQRGAAFSFGPCSERATVDLAAAAQFVPQIGVGGIAAYDTDDNGWNVVEGTSAAAPLVAAIMVRLGLAGKDNHQLFYDHIDAFNDVTSGTNDNDGICDDIMCTAGVGWDGPTGLGTPNGDRLYRLVDPNYDPDAGLPSDAGANGTDGSVAAGAGGGGASGGTKTGEAGALVVTDDAGCGVGDCENANPMEDAVPAAKSAGCSCRTGGDAPWSGRGGAGAILGLAALAVRRRARRPAR